MTLFKMRFISIFFFLTHINTFHLGSKLEIKTIPTKTIIKSKNDKLEYKYVKLENKMNVVLIRDEKTEKSSIAMNVAVGSMQNPKELQGLAHLLEHMLFLGKKLTLIIILRHQGLSG